MSYYRTLMQNTIVDPYLADLIAYYKLDANANDFSLAGNNGFVVGSPTYTAGKVGNAINFGTSTLANYVDIADDIDFSFTDGTNDLPFSVSCWVNVTQFSGILNQILRKRGTSNEEYQIYILSNGQIGLEKYSNGSGSIYQRILSAVGTITLNTWNNIIITNASTSLSGLNIYLNGVLLLTVTRTTVGGTYTRMANGTANIQIGLGTTNFKHRGLVDEYYIWKNRELTAVEALDIYTKGNTGITLI